jgi:hypothetical protein
MGEVVMTEQPFGTELDEEVPPWEARGLLRRDCAPHRGNVLVLLGSVALVCGFAAICLGVPGLLGLPFGLGVYALGQRDLEQMKAGHMDPRGQALTIQGAELAVGGALLNLLGLAELTLGVLLFVFGR